MVPDPTINSVQDLRSFQLKLQTCYSRKSLSLLCLVWIPDWQNHEHSEEAVLFHDILQ